MADEPSTALAGVETEAPAIEDTETQTPETEVEQPEPEAQDGDGEGEQDGEQADEEVEYDLGGGQKVKFKANATAKEVAEHAQKAFKEVEGSFTRKFQDVAERTKSLETREKVVEKLQTLNGAALQEFSRGQSVRSELEQLQKVDLNALWQSNPDQARRVSDALASKRAEFSDIVNKVSQLEGELTKTQEQEVSRRVSEGEAAVEKRIPGFKQKHLSEVIEYVVKEYGYPKDLAERSWARDPGGAVMAYKSMLYDRMQAQAKKATTTAVKPQQQTTPIVPPKAGKGGTAQKNPKDMSPAEMARHLGIT